MNELKRYDVYKSSQSYFIDGCPMYKCSDVDAEIAKFKRVCERSAHVLSRAEVYLPYGSDEECLVEEHLKEISEVAK